MRHVSAMLVIALGCAGPVSAQTAADPITSNFRRTSMVTGGTIGIEFEYLFNQQLQTVTIQNGPAAGSDTAPELEGSTLMLRLGAAWADDSLGIEVWGLVGADDLDASGDVVDSMGNATRFDADRDVALVLGAGARHRFFDLGGFALFLEGWGRWSQADADIQLTGQPATTSLTQLVSWEASLYLAYQFRLGDSVVIAPYGGVLATGARWRMKDFVTSNQRDVLGAMGGIELGITKHISLYAEGRFISETAVVGGLAIEF